jgi:hypothetical protein
MGGDNHGAYHRPKPMARRHGASSLNEYMIHPSSTVRKAWDVLVCMLLLYCALALPLYIAFGVEEHDLLRLLDRMVDCVFMLDVLLNFFTGYTDRGVLIMDQSAVAAKYCRSWLALDLLSSLPMDLILSPRKTMLSGGASDSLLRLHSLVRLLKITRIVRFQRIMQRLQLVLYVKNSFLTVFSIAMVFLFYTHCFACGFIYLARLENYEEHAEFKELKERHHADVQQAMRDGSKMSMTGGMDELSEGVELLDVDAMCSYYVRLPALCCVRMWLNSQKPYHGLSLPSSRCWRCITW